jgi:hypothetical protein
MGDDEQQEDNEQLSDSGDGTQTTADLTTKQRKALRGVISTMNELSSATQLSWYRLFNLAGAAIRLSHTNDFSLYQCIYKLAHPDIKGKRPSILSLAYMLTPCSEEFEGYTTRRSTEYNEIKAKVSEKEWQQIVAEWRRRLADAGQAVEDGRLADPNADNCQIGEFFKGVISQLRGFVSTDLSAYWCLPLTPFSHPGSATSPQFMYYPSSTHAIPPPVANPASSQVTKGSAGCSKVSRMAHATSSNGSSTCLCE